MKRSAIIIALIAVVSLGLAAEASTLSAFYPVRIDVVKVFSHGDGFKVIYRKGTADVGAVYIPARWFVPGGKAELVRASDSSFPYMTIFYKDGKFDHLRLYVLSDQKDETWGVLSPSDGAGKFASDDFKIDF
jgi:hypothetical protein